MKYYWFCLFGSFIIFAGFVIIRLRYLYSKYIDLKVKEDPNFDIEKYQKQLADFFYISTSFIKENDIDPQLIKVKENYNYWVKFWWYQVATLLVLTLIGYIIIGIF